MRHEAPMAKTTVKKNSGSRRAKKQPRNPVLKAKTRVQIGETITEIPTDVSSTEGMSPSPSPEVLNRLWAIIESRKSADPAVSHSARLLAKGTPQIVQKLGEELVECLIEAMAGNHAGLVNESADLLYHLLVTWVNAGIQPQEIWSELERREKISHMIENGDIPLKDILNKSQTQTTKIP
jgi:phosphoribosyl-ATP pyrophosphohydrolase